MSVKIKGVDISRAQENFDFDGALKTGMKFIIIRAGIRTDEDSYFRKNLEACQKNNIPYGLYWYFEATSDEEFEKELAACKKAISGLKPQYPVFFDMEEKSQIEKLDKKTRTDMAIRFCNEMTAIGLPSGIYTNPSWLETYFDKDRIIGKYDIWLAHWTDSPDHPSKYDYGQTMWQWGVDNIGGKDVDGNICFINYPSKVDYWYKTHDGEATPAAKPSYPAKPNTQPIEKAYKADDAVQLKNTALYGSSTTSQPANHLTGTYYIHAADDTVNGRVRITTPKGCKDCTGWVDVSDIIDKPDTADSSSDNNLAEFKVGDIVRIKSGAKSYDGISLSNWVYTKRFYVASVTKDRVLLNKSPDDAVFAINTPFNKSDLIKC